MKVQGILFRGFFCYIYIAFLIVMVFFGDAPGLIGNPGFVIFKLKKYILLCQGLYR